MVHGNPQCMFTFKHVHPALLVGIVLLPQNQYRLLPDRLEINLVRELRQAHLIQSMTDV